MKYLQIMIAGLLITSSLFAELPENQSWNNIRFSPKLATDDPAYSLINIRISDIGKNMMHILHILLQEIVVVYTLEVLLLIFILMVCW